jgi:hypothetical protein
MDHELTEEERRTEQEKASRKRIGEQSLAVAKMTALPVVFLLTIGATWGAMTTAMATCSVISSMIGAVGFGIVIAIRTDWRD